MQLYLYTVHAWRCRRTFMYIQTVYRNYYKALGVNSLTMKTTANKANNEFHNNKFVKLYLFAWVATIYDTKV